MSLLNINDHELEPLGLPRTSPSSIHGMGAVSSSEAIVDLKDRPFLSLATGHWLLIIA